MKDSVYHTLPFYRRKGNMYIRLKNKERNQKVEEEEHGKKFGWINVKGSS